MVTWLDRNSFFQSFQPLFTNKGIVRKFTRIIRIHFFRKKLSTKKLRQLTRQDLFKNLLISKSIKKVVEDEARVKKISIKKAQENAKELIKEIASNFSYEAIRVSDLVLGWVWNRLYQELNVCNAERVRHLEKQGHRIVYIPCHRSHMDYLLLSYVLYHKGLMPPHIVAGINLNFWPVGPIFRRLGAFFIRRNFKGHKLYSTIFREYLGELFTRGYSVEYFIEGSRSRTGRLLEPKTGTLTMTLQTMLRNNSSTRPTTLIPVYVGYEHVIEAESYVKELRGARKEKEGLWKVLRGLCKLRNLGHGYINFGDPLSLEAWLSKRIHQWRDSIESTEIHRPGWLSPVVNDIAFSMMVRINNAAATNAVNLCSSILLCSHQNSLTRSQLLSQLTCYLSLLRNVPYASDVTIPNLTPEELLTHALEMNKFTIKDDVIFLSYDQAVLVTYYRNNIQHLLILPSLVASIIFSHVGIQKKHLRQQIKLIYPLIKVELFMRFSKQELIPVIDNLITELERQGLVKIQGEHLYPAKKQHWWDTLELLAAISRDTLQRYTIMFLLTRINSQFDRRTLEREGRIVTHRLEIFLSGTNNTSEFFDKTLLSTLMTTLRVEEYINDTGNVINKKVEEMCDILSKLITSDTVNVINALIFEEKRRTSTNI